MYDCFEFWGLERLGHEKGLNERERRKRASQKKEEKGKRQREGLVKILLAFCSLYAVFLWHMRCKFAKPTSQG